MSLIVFLILTLGINLVLLGAGYRAGYVRGFREGDKHGWDEGAHAGYELGSDERSDTINPSTDVE